MSTTNTSRKKSPRKQTPPLTMLLGAFTTATVLAIAAAVVYNIPSVKARVDNALYYRWQFLQADIRDTFFPPDEFLPTAPAVATDVAVVMPSATVAPSFEDVAVPTSTAIPTATAFDLPTATPEPTVTPLPAQTILGGMRHEYQNFNNCGPASLSMALSYWGFEGDQETIAAWVKPHNGDKNVRPDELADYVNTVESARYAAVRRVGGDLDLLRDFISAGFPVLVEKAYVLDDKGWMGHYLPLYGFDDTLQVFYSQDSYLGPNQTIGYAELDAEWQTFNRTFIVTYPLQDELMVLHLLGDHADMNRSYEIALATALAEIEANPDDAFAWHNLGTNHNFFGNAADAAAAFDQARAIGLPWRMLWYQSGMYRAYYNVGRYDDVFALANETLSSMTEANHEESLFWRGWAYYATGEPTKAIDDFQRALYFNHNFTDARDALDIVSGQ